MKTLRYLVLIGGGATLLGIGVQLLGCASGFGSFGLLGSPFFIFDPNAGGQNTTNTPSGTQTGSSGTIGGAAGTTDPCDEQQARKFVRIAMRNLNEVDNIHYFLVLIAFINGDRYPTGAVCVDDIAIYRSFGYEEVLDGDEFPIGNTCVTGPALVYFHENGNYRAADGSLASGIEPSRGTGATFDNFFTSAGALVPIPDRILFQNPGTGDGFDLKVAFTPNNPCTESVGVSQCGVDAFYYVDENDLPVGSTALGVGSSRRVPAEIQGTGCECRGSAEPFQVLAPSGTTASNAECNEFVRGGRIDYAFIRDDVTPPIPQLVWRVTDASGSVIHDFDSAANVSP